MRFINYVYFFGVLLEYKINMLCAYFKYGKFWKGLTVDNDYFYPYTFKLMAKSYFGALLPWEEALYRDMRIKHNNSHEDHWEHYVCNNEPFKKRGVYEVGELSDSNGKLYTVQTPFKEIFCFTVTKAKADMICKRFNTKVCKPSLNMPDVYVVLMLKRWEIEGDVEAKLSKYLDGDYAIGGDKVLSFANVMYPDLNFKL